MNASGHSFFMDWEMTIESSTEPKRYWPALTYELRHKFKARLLSVTNAIDGRIMHMYALFLNMLTLAPCWTCIARGALWMIVLLYIWGSVHQSLHGVHFMHMRTIELYLCLQYNCRCSCSVRSKIESVHIINTWVWTCIALSLHAYCLWSFAGRREYATSAVITANRQHANNLSMWPWHRGLEDDWIQFDNYRRCDFL